ncbi:MAG: DUF5675 family protein [Cyclobacteriaceae bacterium]
MKHLAALLFVALLTMALLLFLTNPELLEEIWLWIIGFIGYIILLLEKGFQSIRNALVVDEDRSLPVAFTATAGAAPPTKGATASDKALPQKIAQIEAQLRAENSAGPALADSTITVLRYLDDGQTSLGLLFVRKKFFAYTLEDTHRDEKVAGETRIPSGSYALGFYPHHSPLTEKYRATRPWFQYHLEIKEVPGFQHVYVHVGNTHVDTQGCLLIADGVTAHGPDKMISYSRIAFERFYKTISALLQTGEEVTINILDEDWFERAKLQPI